LPLTSDRKVFTMKLPRRKFLALAMRAASLPAASRVVTAQVYSAPHQAPSHTE
jgi:hypothetical protein